MKRRQFVQSSLAGLALGVPGVSALTGCAPSAKYTDAGELEDETLIEADLCIVGAGAAGISMALECIGTSLDVVLLEAGGLDYSADSQEAYRGDIVGNPYFPLQAARLRQFGGTTGHWAGFCAPFDPADFERREWVPNSGWPIDLQELLPYYERAHPVLELGPFEWEPSYWEGQDPEVRRLQLGDSFRTKMWQFSPPTRFGNHYRDEIVDAQNLHLYTNATVVEINSNENVASIVGLRVRTANGRQHTVRAKRYVMACGAIQNARLLLASNRQAPNGMGNENDLVGRHFMEHIEMPGANVVFDTPPSLKMYTARPRIADPRTLARGELGLTESRQREHRILNGTASISPGQWEGIMKSTFQNITPERLERIREAGERRNRSSGGATNPTNDPAGEYRFFTRQEQAPNPDSRVTLSNERDAYGVPRARLDWQLTELDKFSIRRFYELLGQEIETRELGRLQIADWLLDEDLSSWPDFLSGGWHHMGTTRMHDDARQGVVDADCRVHGLDNLYIAGSAAFATSAAPNPTLTLVALTIRLADHLKSTIRS